MNDVKLTVLKSKVSTIFLVVTSIVILLLSLFVIIGLLFEGIKIADLLDFIVFAVTLFILNFCMVVESIKHLFSPNNIITIYNNGLIFINSFKIKTTISVDDIDKVKVGWVKFSSYIRIYLKNNMKIKLSYTLTSNTIEEFEKYLNERKLMK